MSAASSRAPRPRDTLFARLALIVVAGLVAGWAVSFVSVWRDRMDRVDQAMLAHAGRDVAAAVDLLSRLPVDERGVWLDRLSRPNYRFLASAADAAGAAPAAGVPLRDLAEAGTALERGFAGVLRQVVGPGRYLGARRQADGTTHHALRLADGTPLQLAVRPPPPWFDLATATRLAAELAAVLAAVAWGVRWATRPLRALAQAADQVAGGQRVAPLPERGPWEVRTAATAFNAMQRRIAAQLDERLRILAAVSHDLQSPITRLRLRLELLDRDDAARLEGDLDAMSRLVAEGLAYARSAHAETEPAQRVDVGALVDALVGDEADAGRPVRRAGPPTADATVDTRPHALRRLMSNLVDNAVKYGGAAEVSVTAGPGGVVIRVADRGPGIPLDRRADVMQPFVRLEDSRNRDTGGTGLGLAIAEQLARALDATLSLEDREGGGLVARLVLPGPRIDAPGKG